ncbi:MAG TPA: TolC family protein [Oculatellaceae cyanobacterium]
MTERFRADHSKLLSSGLCLCLGLSFMVGLTSVPALAAQNPAGPTQLPSTVSPQTPVNLPSESTLTPPQAPTTPSTMPPSAVAPITLPPNFKLRDLPSEQAGHEDSSVLKASPIKIGALIQVAQLQPLTLDGQFSKPITLNEALSYALENNLPIRISKESAVYQTAQLGYYCSFFLPALTTNYSIAQSHINSITRTNANVFITKASFPLFVGGNYMYFAWAQYLRQKGWKLAYQANINDALLDVYNRYTSLVLNHHLLRIRLHAVAVSEAQLRQNEELYQAGNGTRFAIMQSRTQLATDRQALLAQQVTTRQSALQLAYVLNMPLSVNLVPADLDLTNRPLIHRKMQVGQLLDLAFHYRPEVKEYEVFRQAAARDVQIGASSLYPVASIFVAYTRSNLNFAGSAAGLNGAAVTQIALAGANTGGATNVALGQTASLSPGENLTAASGANTGAASIVAASGGTPISNTQSGSLVTSGAVAPSIIAPAGVAGTSGASNINGSNTASAGTAPGLFNTVQVGLNLSWSLGSLGMNSVANIVGLRALSRQALLQQNQEAQVVIEQVRSSYLNAITATNQVESTGSRLDSTREALRLAELRLNAGQGTNLELLRAQNDYIDALTTEAQSIIALQQAEAQLIHDLGLISIQTLTQGLEATNLPVKK